MPAYADSAVRFDRASPYTRQYPSRIDTRFVLQDRPVPDNMRSLAAPVILPAEVTVTFCLGDDVVTPPPNWFHAGLDPAANRGYDHVSFSSYYETRIGFSVSVSRPGDTQSATLTTCPRCGDPWTRATQHAWGNATDCETCSYHDFYSIGD